MLILLPSTKGQSTKRVNEGYIPSITIWFSIFNVLEYYCNKALPTMPFLNYDSLQLLAITSAFSMT